MPAFNRAPTTFRSPPPTQISLPLVFVGFKQNPHRPDDSIIGQPETAASAKSGDPMMHDLLIALAFVGMVIAPAVVGARVKPSEDLE